MASDRAALLRQLLLEARQKLNFDIGFALWDGSTVPANLPHSALAIAFADEGAIGALLRRSKLDTLLNLWVTARIDLRNGTFFDLAARRPKIRAKELLRNFDKGLLLRTAFAFLPAPAGGPWPLDNIKTPAAQRDGSAASNMENVAYHYDVSNKFYSIFSTRRWSTPARTSPTGTMTSRRHSKPSST